MSKFGLSVFSAMVFLSTMVCLSACVTPARPSYEGKTCRQLMIDDDVLTLEIDRLSRRLAQDTIMTGALTAIGYPSNAPNNARDRDLLTQLEGDQSRLQSQMLHQACLTAVTP